MAEEVPAFLELEIYRHSRESAKRTVIQYLLAVGIKSPQGGWEKAEFELGTDGMKKFWQLVQVARETGIVPYIQGRIDKSDDIFGGTFGISTPTSAFGPITSTYAGYTRTLTPPMTDQPVESDLAEDILFYREESCIYSDEYDFVFCARYYRAYLSSCIALIDAFINRHILIYKHQGKNSDDFQLLQRTGRLEERLELFLKISTGRDITAINGGDEWKHFKELRRLRNEMTHISSPTLGYSIGEFADHFNYVRAGVGGLLYKIRELQGKMSLGFIERLRTAPKVYFNHITHKADGNHLVKRKK